ncbi:hypothetical protein JYU34_012371 [Plutella xylostella]|uniref:Uncharacterized protein n=1 Tax=Plutella xylostella TaxID=51655 RepID=A0ABQ7QC62_PLUXY|nr:hypothetical protein JYU34_012371 [Plutella xylostella]
MRYHDLATAKCLGTLVPDAARPSVTQPRPISAFRRRRRRRRVRGRRYPRSRTSPAPRVAQLHSPYVMGSEMPAIARSSSLHHGRTLLTGWQVCGCEANHTNSAPEENIKNGTSCAVRGSAEAAVARSRFLLTPPARSQRVANTQPACG